MKSAKDEELQRTDRNEVPIDNRSLQVEVPGNLIDSSPRTVECGRKSLILNFKPQKNQQFGPGWLVLTPEPLSKAEMKSLSVCCSLVEGKIPAFARKV